LYSKRSAANLQYPGLPGSKFVAEIKPFEEEPVSFVNVAAVRDSVKVLVDSFIEIDLEDGCTIF
jgi:hypothetical protein